MSPLATFLFLANLLVDTAGHLVFKKAAIHEGDASTLKLLRSLARNGFIWTGIACFTFEFVIWLAFLSLVPLSQAVLVGCANILGVMIGGRIFFGEKITLPRSAAILLIAFGVGLVGWGNP